MTKKQTVEKNLVNASQYNADGNKLDNPMDFIVVEKVYNYRYPKTLKDGSIKYYNHKVTYKKNANIDSEQSFLRSELSKIKTLSYDMKLLHSLMNDILHFKGYSERNKFKQLNTLKAKGIPSKDIKNMINDVYSFTNDISDDLLKQLNLLLNYLKEKKLESEKIAKELQNLDSGKYDKEFKKS